MHRSIIKLLCLATNASNLANAWLLARSPSQEPSTLAQTMLPPRPPPPGHDLSASDQTPSRSQVVANPFGATSRSRCSSHVTRMVYDSCWNAGLDDSRRIRAALALTMCDMHASDSRSIPRECIAFDSYASAFDLENVDEVTQRQCVDAIFRSERDWISYVNFREKIPSTCQAYLNEHGRDLVKEIVEEGLQQHRKVSEAQLRNEQMRGEHDAQHAAFLDEWQDRMNRQEAAAAELRYRWFAERDAYMAELAARHAHLEERWDERDEHSKLAETALLDRVNAHIQSFSSSAIERSANDVRAVAEQGISYLLHAVPDILQHAQVDHGRVLQELHTALTLSVEQHTQELGAVIPNTVQLIRHEVNEVINQLREDNSRFANLLAELMSTEVNEVGKKLVVIDQALADMDMASHALSARLREVNSDATSTLNQLGEVRTELSAMQLGLSDVTRSVISLNETVPRVRPAWYDSNLVNYITRGAELLLPSESRLSPHMIRYLLDLIGFNLWPIVTLIMTASFGALQIIVRRSPELLFTIGCLLGNIVFMIQSFTRRALCRTGIRSPTRTGPLHSAGTGHALTQPGLSPSSSIESEPDLRTKTEHVIPSTSPAGGTLSKSRFPRKRPLEARISRVDLGLHPQDLDYMKTLPLSRSRRLATYPQ